MRDELLEYLALDLFVFGRRLDDEIAAAEQRVVDAGLDSAERRRLVVLAQQRAFDLAVQVLVDGRERRVELVLRQVDELHVESGCGADMGNAIAHLPGADHADGLNHSPTPNVLLRRDAYSTLSSSSSSSGTIVKRSPTIP